MRSVDFLMLFLTFSAAWLLLVVMPVLVLGTWFVPSLGEDKSAATAAREERV